MAHSMLITSLSSTPSSDYMQARKDGRDVGEACSMLPDLKSEDEREKAATSVPFEVWQERNVMSVRLEPGFQLVIVQARLGQRRKSVSGISISSDCTRMTKSML